MSLVGFGRYSSMFPPERELLTIESDGSFSMWRSFGEDTAGRFAGSLPDPANITSLANAAGAAEPPAPVEIEADASVEELEVGAARAEFEADVPLGGPWGELATACRDLLRQLTAFPRAVVAGELRPGGVFRLEHRGSEPIPIELASLQIRIVRWHGGREADSVSVAPADLGRTIAAPGWSLEIPFDEGVLGEGQVVGTATFVAEDDGVFVPVVVTSRG